LLIESMKGPSWLGQPRERRTSRDWLAAFEKRRRGVPSLTWLAACVLWIVPVAVGCGGAAYAPEAESAGAYAGEPAPPPVAPQQQQASATGYGYSFEDSISQSSLRTEKTSGRDAKVDSPRYESQEPPPPQKGEPASVGKPQPKPDTPLIVYSGYLRLQVRRVLETVDAITAKTEALGGYVESLTRSSLVVRIPAKDFDRVMLEFAQLGDVQDRRIQAADVTQEFTDLGARLAVAREARARLLALLENTTNASERLQIVAEVKRLTEQIEEAESKLEALQNLVDYYTISLELVPLIPESQAVAFQSPFGWVHALSPLHASLTEGRGDFTWALPPSFVVFDKADEFRAQSADTALVRAARVDNEPVGDAAFWTSAVAYDFDGRGEKRDKQGVQGRVHYQVFVNDDLKPRYYLVGICVEKDDVFVIEAFFPNEESYKRHLQAVITSFDGFQAQ
jgi:hypothetical protein